VAVQFILGDFERRLDNGDWLAHSLRSGFFTKIGRKGLPLRNVIAMTENRSIATVVRYFRAG
jgi:hypothetical protein